MTIGRDLLGGQGELMAGDTLSVALHVKIALDRFVPNQLLCMRIQREHYVGNDKCADSGGAKKCEGCATGLLFCSSSSGVPACALCLLL